MTDSASLITELDSLQKAIRDRDEAQQSANHFTKLATKLDGEVARLSGVVVALLGAPAGTVTVEAAPKVDGRRKNGGHLPIAKGVSARETARSVMERLLAGSPDGLPARELPGDNKGAALSILRRTGKAHKLPNGNWAAV